MSSCGNFVVKEMTKLPRYFVFVFVIPSPRMIFEYPGLNQINIYIIVSLIGIRRRRSSKVLISMECPIRAFTKGISAVTCKSSLILVKWPCFCSITLKIMSATNYRRNTWNLIRALVSFFAKYDFGTSPPSRQNIDRQNLFDLICRFVILVQNFT